MNKQNETNKNKLFTAFHSKRNFHLTVNELRNPQF